MGKIIWICVGAVIVWAGTILLMHRIQTKKIKKLEDDYREKQRVQQKLREEYSVKVQNKQAKIAALQSQINPHFLYNTLECIRSEALLYECDSIARMAKALAAFFRYSISNKENIVTIRDELRNIENYFLIQSYRFENKFALEINVEDDREEVGNYLIPKLSLQPIVENAITHGIEELDADAVIEIKGIEHEKSFEIEITDSGIGMSEKQLAILRRKLRMRLNSDTQPKHGIGLRNVQDRIHIQFGTEYGLSVYTKEHCYTKVSVHLPITRGKYSPMDQEGDEKEEEKENEYTAGCRR